MKNWKGFLLGSALALGVIGPAFAAHEHHLETPGTWVEDIASGQTRKSENEPGGHKFHENVHTGTPGTKAFENGNNPVSVGKGESCP